MANVPHFDVFTKDSQLIVLFDRAECSDDFMNALEAHLAPFVGLHYGDLITPHTCAHIATEIEAYLLNHICKRELVRDLEQKWTWNL